MALTHDDVLSILKIIDESPYDEVRLEIGDLKLHVKRRGDSDSLVPVQTVSKSPERQGQGPAEQQRPAQALPPSAMPAHGEQLPIAPTGSQPLPEGLIAVRAPMLGTFYRASAPGEPPFVEVGDKVGPDDTVCLVEVMKLFHSVKAGVAGTVVKILVENGSMVEHGQVLVLIESYQRTPDAAIQ